MFEKKYVGSWFRRNNNSSKVSHGCDFTQVKSSWSEVKLLKWRSDTKVYSKEVGTEKLSEKSHRIDFTQVKNQVKVKWSF